MNIKPLDAIRQVGAVALILAGAAVAAESTRVTDEASAIAAAKRYTKARCSATKPCEFRPRREGKQWNVWVGFSMRSGGGHALLYFNEEGQLVRRVEGD